MAKRLREESNNQEMESAAATNLLLLRSFKFTCKICKRHFPSFQALGGHCTGHKRARIGELANPFNEMLQRAKPKPGIYKCTICGQKFDTGQALGGHMRRHRGLFKSQRQLHEETSAAKGMFMDMDSNTTPRLLDLFV